MVEKQKRKIYLDNLRMILAVLVIIGHVAVTYSPIGYWYYNEASNTFSSYFLAFVVALLQTFIIGLFFMLSSYFIPASYMKKGSIEYFLERIKRLGIPLLVYVFVINPAILYLLYFFEGKQTTGFFSFYYNNILRAARFDTGPLWFIQLLLIFTLFYLIIREISKRTGLKGTKPHDFPSYIKITVFIVIMAVVTFMVRAWFPIGRVVGTLQLSFIPQYVILFIIGLYAYHNNWFIKISHKTAMVWSITGLVSILLWPLIIYAGGAFSTDITFIAGSFYWQSLVYSIWESVVCVGLIIGIIYLFKNKFDHQNIFFKKLSRSAYAVFIIHPIVIIPLSFLLRDIGIDPILKFFIVTIIAVPTCFFLALLLRKIRLIRKII